MSDNPPTQPAARYDGFADAWTTAGFGDGIRHRAGGRQVPLGELLNAVLGAGLRLHEVSESADADFPTRIGAIAVRRSGREPRGGSLGRASKHGDIPSTSGF